MHIVWNQQLKTGTTSAILNAKPFQVVLVSFPQTQKRTRCGFVHNSVSAEAVKKLEWARVSPGRHGSLIYY